VAFQAAGQLVQDRSVVLLIAWIDMLEHDSLARAATASSFFTALSGAFHFHDPDRAIGEAVAHSTGGAGKIAWDFYLVYAKGVQWNEAAPSPFAWFHQLQEEPWASPDRFRSGQDLSPAIRQTLEEALGFRAA
jgi:hypothetical protein